MSSRGPGRWAWLLLPGLWVCCQFPSWLLGFIGAAARKPDWTRRGRSARGDGAQDRDWSLTITPEEAAAGLTQTTMASAAVLLNSTGFVVLRGASLFTEEELTLAQGTAEIQLGRVQAAAERLNLLERAPWVKGHDTRKLFEFQEAKNPKNPKLHPPNLCLDADAWFFLCCFLLFFFWGGGRGLHVGARILKPSTLSPGSQEPYKRSKH